MGKISEELYAKACAVMPGGVNSPVRAFKAVGGGPLFIKQGQGSRLVDADDRSYIDYCMSWGVLILGHAHPFVVEALKKAVVKGLSYGAPTAAETELAEAVAAAFPSVEKVRLTPSGTEAVMSAVRLARACTGRDLVVKVDGGYHGHGDQMLVQSGSGVLTFGLPGTPGIPADVTKHTLSIPYNDTQALKELAARHGESVAAFIVEPVMGNAGVIPPDPDYLSTLRAVCDQMGALLILDEVITGFRVAYGGAQELYGVKADLTTMGKVLGGGLPLAAYGGRKDLMERIAPEGPVYQAGTYAGNPLAVQAGLATLKVIKNAQTYEQLEERGAALEAGIREIAGRYEVPLQVNRVGSMFTLFFTASPVRDLASAQTANTKMFTRFFNLMLEGGVYLPPSQFEAGFISMAHSTKDLEDTLEAADRALKTVAREFELGPYR
jgi:glutamate-1-semialdehyde 2,1-aminomutase